MNKPAPHPKIYRSFALPLSTFEYLKRFQRKYQARHNVLITNNQAITLILAQHELSTEVVSYGS